MKFSCTQENLKKGLTIISSIASKSVNLPILSNVLMKIEGNSIQMISTNLEIAVKCAIRGKVEEAGEYTFPSKLLLDYVNLLPQDRVDLEMNEPYLRLTCRKNSTKIKGLPSSEFPLIPKVEPRSSFYLKARDLKKALNQVNFAVSTVESRPELTGILFNVNPSFAPGKLVLAATDSYRLSERTLTLRDAPDAKSTDRQVTAVVPGKTLSELARILSVFKDADAPEFVQVVLGESQIVFRFEDVEIISRVIEGRYPDYRPIIPDRFSTEAVVSVPEIVQAVKSAALFARSGLQDVHLELDAKEGLKVASSEGQMGKNESTVDAKISGQKNAITVNYRYFLDGMGAIDAPTVRLKMIDAMNPCVLAPEGADADNAFLYIVMPIKQ